MVKPKRLKLYKKKIIKMKTTKNLRTEKYGQNNKN